MNRPIYMDSPGSQGGRFIMVCQAYQATKKVNSLEYDVGLRGFPGAAYGRCNTISRKMKGTVGDAPSWPEKEHSFYTTLVR